MHAAEDTCKGVRRYELCTGRKGEKDLALYLKLGYREYQRKPRGKSVMLACVKKPGTDRKIDQ